MNDPHPKDGQSLPMAGNNLSRICGVRPEFLQSTTALPMPAHIGGSEGGEVAAGIGRESVIRMAREAGSSTSRDHGPTYWEFSHDSLQRFAALVAAATREACAQEFDSRDNGIGFYDPDEPAKIIRAKGFK